MHAIREREKNIAYMLPKPSHVTLQFPETGQLRQHSNPEAFFCPVGEENTKRKKSKDKKYSLGELISNGFTPPSPSFLRKALHDKRVGVCYAAYQGIDENASELSYNTLMIIIV